jgi:uncharacterized membrane protein YcaP (DUF421 family)
MQQFLIALFGVQDHLTTAQEGARAVLIFAYGLALFRLIGPRVFGRWSALDFVVVIIVGSALARAMTGGAPLLGTMAAVAIIAVLHMVLAYGAAKSRAFAGVVEGKEVTLIRHGRIDHQARMRNLISEADLREALRQEGVDGEAGAGNVKAMTLEPSGKLSVVKIDPCKPNRA